MSDYKCVIWTDAAREAAWPETFVKCPQIGDYVTATNGTRLVVRGINHRVQMVRGKSVPQIEVELGK